jgi:hypothetical protein
MKKLFLFCNISAMMFLVSCKQEHIESFDSEESNLVITRQEPKCFLSFRKYKQWLSAHTGDYKMLNIAYAINRTDSTNLKNGFDFDSGRYERRY